jgi:hypothetical protein
MTPIKPIFQTKKKEEKRYVSKEERKSVLLSV